MLTYTLVVSVPESVSQDDLIESLGVDGHGDLMDVEVIFCGPGSLLRREYSSVGVAKPDGPQVS